MRNRTRGEVALGADGVVLCRAVVRLRFSGCCQKQLRDLCFVSHLPSPHFWVQKFLSFGMSILLLGLGPVLVLT